MAASAFERVERLANDDRVGRQRIGLTYGSVPIRAARHCRWAS